MRPDVENFERVPEGAIYATVDREDLTADEPFWPIVMSEDGSEDIFGYRGLKIGESLEDEKGTWIRERQPRNSERGQRIDGKRVETAREASDRNGVSFNVRTTSPFPRVVGQAVATGRSSVGSGGIISRDRRSSRSLARRDDAHRLVWQRSLRSFSRRYLRRSEASSGSIGSESPTSRTPSRTVCS